MIVVVGGGVTGLAVGWEMQGTGRDFVVLEASPRAGGVIRSKHVDGRVLDAGPQRMRLTPSMRDLASQLGIEDRLVTAPEGLDLFVYARGRLRVVPMSLRAIPRADIVGWADKVRLALEPVLPGPTSEESVGAFLRRKLGREVYETVAGPIYGGLFGSDPDDMPMAISLLPALRALGVRRSLLAAFMRRGGGLVPAPAASFVAGMQELPDALAANLGPHLRLSTPVRGLSPRPDGGWVVDIDGDTLDAEAVVLTTPADDAARLLRPFAPDATEVIAALHYNSLAVVHLEARTVLRGLGYQVAFGERLGPLRGVTFNESLFGAKYGRSGVYTAFLGGSRHPEVSEMSISKLGDAAVDGFRRCTGSESRVLSVVHQRMPAWDRSWVGLEDVRLPPGLHLAGSWRSRPGLAGRFAEASAIVARVAAADRAPRRGARFETGRAHLFLGRAS